jgi:hypothetical protein
MFVDEHSKPSETARKACFTKTLSNEGISGRFKRIVTANFHQKNFYGKV